MSSFDRWQRPYSHGRQTHSLPSNETIIDPHADLISNFKEATIILPNNTASYYYPIMFNLLMVVAAIVKKRFRKGEHGK